MACSRLRAVLAIVAVTVVALATSASAELVTELGILDLTANGGINPATSSPWQAGDTYRFAFASSGLTAATSSDINYYNAFVQNLANASPLNIGAAQGVTWKAIASTPTVDARDNTSTNVAVNGTGESTFLLDGTSIVATDYTALWTFDGHTTAINKTELLTNPANNLPGGSQWGDTWTGTHRDSYTPGGNYGTKDASSGGGPLGDPDGTAMRGLWPYTSGTHWVWRWGGATTTELPLYGLSDPLTVTEGGGVPVVIPVPNGSFEELYKPGTAIPGLVSPGGWTQGVGPDCPIDSGVYEFSDNSTGPVADIPGWVGADRDGWIALGGTYGRDQTTGNLQGSVARQAAAPDGVQYYLSNGGQWGNRAGGLIVSDAPLATVEAGATYTLSMLANGSATPIVLELLAGGVEVTPTSLVDPVLSGEWQEFSRTYDPASLAGFVGQDLTILLGVGRDAAGTQSHFDSVQLTVLRADIIPEPATLSLLGLGALLALRRRRRSR